MAVARVGSFSGASKAVGVTQSAITKSVADLEQQLGFAIFNRTSRGVAMTPEGRDFIDRAARLLADAADLFGERDRGADPFALAEQVCGIRQQPCRPCLLYTSPSPRDS